MSTPGILMEPMSTTPSVHQSEVDLMSVIVPVVERADDVAAMYRAFADVLDARRQPYEFVFVFDGRITPPAELVALTRDKKNVRILRFAREFGETAALRLRADARVHGDSVARELRNDFLAELKTTASR